MKNYGFIEPVILDDQYILGGFGSLPKIIYQPDGNWTAFLPKYEPQYNSYFDSFGCTIWGTQNTIEIFIKRLTEKEPDYSERYNYIISNIVPPGGDPHMVAEDIRRYGLVDEKVLPFTDKREDFITPKPMTPNYLAKGQEWLRNWEFRHEWVLEGKTTKEKRLAKLKEALQYSPVAVSVTAWHQNNEGLYYSPEGERNTHWCVLYNISEKGYEIFDSYEQSLKTLTFDHEIKYAKRYHLMPQDAPIEAYNPILKGILETLKAIYDQLLKKSFKGIVGSLFKR